MLLTGPSPYIYKSSASDKLEKDDFNMQQEETNLVSCNFLSVLHSFRLIEDHEQFETSLREKQGLVDEATKSRRTLAVEEKVKKKGGKALQRYEFK